MASRSAPPTSLRDVWTTVAAGGEPTESVRLEVDGCRIDLSTDHATVRDRLERYFRHWIREDDAAPDLRISVLERASVELNVDWTIDPVHGADPCDRRTVEDHAHLEDGRLVRKRHTGMVFAYGAGRSLAVGRCLRNVDQVVAFVNDRYVRWRLTKGYLPVRAAAVGRDGRCVALCGTDDTGRSATALRLLAQGLDFVSGDRLLLRASEYGVEVAGVPRHPRANPGTMLSIPALEGMIDRTDRIRLRALPQAELVALAHEYDVMVDEVEGAGRFTTRGHLAALIVFRWGTGHDDPVARPVDLAMHPQLLPDIVDPLRIFHDPGRTRRFDPSPARYLDVLSRRPVVEITVPRDFDAAARLAREVLERYAP